mgnify:CR=1 FL=1
MPLKKKIAKPSSGFKLESSVLQKAITLACKPGQAESSNILDLAPTSFVHLNVIVSKLPSKKNIRPVKIELPVSIHGEDFNSKILFIFSNQSYEKYSSELKEAVPNVKFTSYDKINKNNPLFNDKRNLLINYDFFLCESRVYSLLKKALGKSFYEKKKYPYPVTVEEEIKDPVEYFTKLVKDNVEHSTFFYQSNGPEYSIKVARTEKHTPEQAEKNIRSGLKGLLKILLERGIRLKDVRRVVIKGDKTESFPVYSFLTDEEKEIMKEILAE